MAAAEQLITANLDIWSSAVKAKSAAGRGKSNKLELYGIKKLRELILELAFSGMLVANDKVQVNYEDLLSKMTDEKADFHKRKGVRLQKFKELPDIDVGLKCPASWETVYFDQVIKYITDFQANGSFATLKKNVTYYESPNYALLLRLTDLRHGLTDSRNYKYTDEAGYKFLAKSSIDGGELVIANVGAGVGTTLMVPKLDMPATLAPNMFMVVLSDLISKEYFLYYSQSPAYWKHIEQVNAGTGQPKINKTEYKNCKIPLPSHSEQLRIVAKVDELMALCDQLEQQQETSITAHQTMVQTLLGALTTASERDGFTAAWARITDHFDTLFTTEWSIDQLKQTILQLAVMGKLVPQDSNNEPANKLLKRKKAMNDNDIPFKLPDSWAWASVNEFAETRLGKMLDKAKNKGTPYRYLRNINVRWFDFDLSDVKEMRFEDSELEEFALYRGDVLICEGGYPGRAAVWDERETNIYFQKAIHRVRFQNGVNPNYFVFVLRESADSGRLTSYFTGAGIQHFTGKGLKSFLVPLPPLTEQGRIVAKVDELMVLCDALKVRIQDAQTTQAHFADAIVEQAVA